MKKSLVIFILFIFCLSLYSQPLGENIKKTFEAPEGTNLFLRADGDVNISVWGKRQISVEISIRGSRDFREMYEFELEKRGNTVDIITRQLRNFNFFGFRTGRIRYDIKLPSDTKTEIEQDDGDTDIKNLRAELIIYSEDGNIYLNDIISRTVSIESEDGDVKLYDVSADLYIQTEDGDVITRNIESGKIHLTSEDGDIEIDLKKSFPQRRYSLVTEDGDIEIYLSSDFEGEIDCDTSDGKVRVALSNCEVYEREKHSFRGVVGNKGRGYLKVRSEDGDIWIR